MFENFLKNSKLLKVELNESNNRIKIYLSSSKMDILSLLGNIQIISEEIKKHLATKDYPPVRFDFLNDLYIEFEQELSALDKSVFLYEYLKEKILQVSKANAQMIKKFTLVFLEPNEIKIEAYNDKIASILQKFLETNKIFLNNLGFKFEKILVQINSELFKTKKKPVLKMVRTQPLVDNPEPTPTATKRTWTRRQQSEDNYSELTVEQINQKREQKLKFFSGELFNVEEKKYSNGKGKLFLLSIFNPINEKAITAINFINDVDYQLPYKSGDFIKVYGSFKRDNYSKAIESFQLIVDFIKPSEPLINNSFEQDFSSAPERAEFHLHTSMSTMDGIGTVDLFLNEAKNKNINTLTILDHNSVQAYPDAYNFSKRFPEIKINYGVEFDVIDDINLVIVRNERDEKLINSEYVFFDIEATGLSSLVNEMIEFGGEKLLADGSTTPLQFFVKPSEPIPAHIQELTSISDEDVANGLSEKEALLKIKEFIGDAILVAHNADYDIGFLNNLYQKNGMEPISNPIIDTLKVSWLINPDSKKHRLGAIAKKYNIDYDEEGAHRADYDAKVLRQVYEHFLNEFKELDLKNLLDFNKRLEQIHPKVFSKHISVIAKNQKGLKEIYRLISKAHIETFNVSRNLPQLLLSVLLEFKANGNLLIGSACSNGFLWEEINNGLSLDFFKTIYDYYEIFPPSAYQNLVVNNFYTEKQIAFILQTIQTLGSELQIPVIISGDVHYPKKADAIARTVYILNKGLGGRAHPLFNYRNRNNLVFPQVHLKASSEMATEFETIFDTKILNQLLYDNPKALNKQIEVVVPIREGLFPPKIEGSKEEFINYLNKNLEDKYGKNPPELIQKRVARELDSIINNGYDIIYYLSSLAVRKSLEEGYLVGSRGSVGSSLVATLSDITEVNPLPAHYHCPKCKTVEFIEGVGSGYDLVDKECPKCKTIIRGEGNNIPFETFLGFKGDKVPDIDLNFSGEYQGEIHNYIKELLSEENVFRAGTISTVAQRTAFGYVKNFLEISNNNTFQKADIARLSGIVEGTKRTSGQHPGGLIIVPNDKDIYDFTPINYPGNDVNSQWKTTHFDFHSIHDNLLKLDLLGHLDPSVLKMLQRLTNIDPKTIPLNDAQVLELFNSTNPLKVKNKEILEENIGILGIPEFGTNFVRELVKDVSPDTFADLVRISGLSHGTDVWLGNAKELIASKEASLKEVISVRDDIMTYLIDKGLDNSSAFFIMESVRKGKGLTPEWEKMMLENQVPKWYIDSCKKIKYMFPKAHATAYVIMAFRIAWYKINYPLEYYATFFSKRDTEFALEILFKKDGAGNIISREADELFDSYQTLKLSERNDKENTIFQTLEIVLEMYARGYKISPIDLNDSFSHDWQPDPKHQNALLPPFIIIEGLGDVAAQKIADQAALEPYLTLEDFKARSGLNKTLIEKFETSGLLKNLKVSVAAEDDSIKQKRLEF